MGSWATCLVRQAGLSSIRGWCRLSSYMVVQMDKTDLDVALPQHRSFSACLFCTTPCRTLHTRHAFPATPPHHRPPHQPATLRAAPPHHARHLTQPAAPSRATPHGAHAPPRLRGRRRRARTQFLAAFYHPRLPAAPGGQCAACALPTIASTHVHATYVAIAGVAPAERALCYAHCTAALTYALQPVAGHHNSLPSLWACATRARQPFYVFFRRRHDAGAAHTSVAGRRRGRQARGTGPGGVLRARLDLSGDAGGGLLPSGCQLTSYLPPRARRSARHPHSAALLALDRWFCCG